MVIFTPWDRIRKKSPTKQTKVTLVGGFNPFQKYWSKWEPSPNSENEKDLKPPPRTGPHSLLRQKPKLCQGFLTCFAKYEAFTWQNLGPLLKVYPPGKDHISHRKGSSENHRLKSAGFWEGICDREPRRVTFSRLLI